MKIGFLITARLKSSRLPFKIVRRLKGKTVIERIIDRAKVLHEISEIILCTSKNPQDKPLVDIACNNGIYYFNGSEEDVLSRLSEAARLFGLDYFIGITGDNPLFSIDYSYLIINEMKKDYYDYIKVEGLPLGCGPYGIKTKALQTVCSAKDVTDTEIWGHLIDQPGVFSIQTIKAAHPYNNPLLRLTLDYEEDYRLINHLYTHIPFDEVLSLIDVVEYLEKNPGVKLINRHCKQASLPVEVKNKINEFYENNHEKIMQIKKEIYGRAYDE